MTDEVYSKAVVDEIAGGLMNTQLTMLRLFFEDQIARGDRNRPEVALFAKQMAEAARSGTEQEIWKRLAGFIDDDPRPLFEVIEGGKAG